MSEAFSMDGGYLPVGSRMAGRLDTHAICAACGHLHQRTEGGFGQPTLTWIAGCWCGCRADHNEYDGIEVECSPRRVADVVAAARTHDDDYDDLAVCPIHHLAGICAELGRSNAPAVRSVEPGGSVRRRRLGWLKWPRVSRLPRHLRGQLVFPRRWY